MTDTSKGTMRAALGAMTAALFLATGASAQDAPKASQTDINDDTSTDTSMTRVDSAILFYQESGGRIQATEPVVSVTMNDDSGNSIRVKLTADTLTGATPNGAAPWTGTQTFLTPTRSAGARAGEDGVQTTTTSASGNKVLVTVPGTNVTAAQYAADPNTLPMDHGFRDQRYAVDLGYTVAIDNVSRFTIGGNLSTEHDYSSLSGNFGLSRDLNDKNTTLSAALSVEMDTSKPYFGTPTPMTEMSGLAGKGTRNKTVVDAVFGVSQVVNRYWLAQLDYNIDSVSGYQTDPYRIISVVNGTTGAPVKYLYESRPTSRLRQSLYFGNKIALGPTVADASLRAYHDSWGINSLTADISERVPVTKWMYVEPHLRYYSQTKANFFHDYLVSGQTLPAFASSDSRLGTFQATTIGLKVGVRVGPGELYGRAESYSQTGTSHPVGAPGALAQENLFSGVKATSVVVGYTFGFW